MTTDERDHTYITKTQCRRRYGLSQAEIASLGRPRIGAPRGGSNRPSQLYRLDEVLALVERLRPEREARDRAVEEARARRIAALDAIAARLGRELVARGWWPNGVRVGAAADPSVAVWVIREWVRVQDPVRVCAVVVEKQAPFRYWDGNGAVTDTRPETLATAWIGVRCPEDNGFGEDGLHDFPGGDFARPAVATDEEITALAARIDELAARGIPGPDRAMERATAIREAALAAISARAGDDAAEDDEDDDYNYGIGQGDDDRVEWCSSCGWATRGLGEPGAPGPRYCFNPTCTANDCDIWDDMEACGAERPTLELLPGECCACACIHEAGKVYHSPICDGVDCECHEATGELEP